MWTGGLVLLLLASAGAITRDQFYPHGPGLDQRLPRGAEVSSPEIALNVPIVFFGETYESIFVNKYGVLSFRADIPTFINAEFPLPYPSIAAFYANIDTTVSGEVYYRETNESHILVKAEESVQNNFHEYYDFRPKSVFIATWIDVTYSSKQRQDRKNSFQIAIISNGVESFVEMLYPEREIQWIQKDPQPGSLPDAKAQAGFIAEDGRLFTLRGSGSHQIRNVVSWSNTREPGKYVFRVGNIPNEGTVAVPDQYDQNEVEVEEETKTCAQSGPSICHLQARCVDYQAGICCKCNDGFYGNGKSCIKDDVPLRVHGKLNGILNNENLNDVDLQAYVVVADGRTYTALSQAPASLGSSLQLLNVLGGVIGWLFAKPSESARNGYQLTGGLFNHTADIFFPETKDRVIINQEYVGHDVFDQITLDADVRGTIPTVMSGSRLEMSEYDEEYTIVEPGLIHSASSRTFTNKITGQKYEQRITQTITYNPCKYAPTSEEDSEPLTLKVIKNYLGYETRENIVRYSTSNKIKSRGQEDPCVEGRSSCGPHSTCAVQGDSFTCVCQSGFTSIYYQDAITCVDIDECAAATHNCDNNADCYNHDGGFQCRCRDGYEGNGVSCNIVSRCSENTCGLNAVCIDNPMQGPVCVCKTGFIGDGQTCQEEVRNACSRCSPYAYCGYSDEINDYKCQCNTGYTGDGEYCTEDTYSVPDVTETSEISVAPLHTTTPTSSEADYNRTYVLPTCETYDETYNCYCPPGYTRIKDERNNDLCRIDSYREEPTDSSNVGDNDYGSRLCETDSDCAPNAICIFMSEQSEQSRGKCVCPEGYDGNGYNCKRLSRCADKLCGRYAQCIEIPSKGPNCVCKIGFTGDGYTCQEIVHNTCSRCSPYAYCSYTDHQSYKCQCYPGYTGNGIYCTEDYRSVPDVSATSEISVAPLQSTTPVITEAEYNETYVLPNCETYENDYQCVCPTGYSRFKDERNNELCRIDSYKEETTNTSNNEENSDSSITCSTDTECPPNAICLFTAGQTQGHCVCPEGYEGDAYECIERTGSTCSCGPSAHCIDTAAGEMMCVCDPGYHGDGYVCRPNFSCTNNSDCEYNAECRPDPGSEEYVCQCIEGYIKDQNDACIPDGQLCNGAVCAEHASCLFDETLQVNYCSCDEGFEGEGIFKCVPRGRTCDVANDCSTNAICTPTEATYQCICREGYTGDGYTCNPEINCRTNIYLCDVHASCLKTSEGYACECNTGYTGNGSYCELNPRQTGNFLVASDGASVYRVPFKVTPRDFATPFNSDIYQIAVGIEADCHTGRIYWGDVGSSAIKRASYDGSNFEQFLAYDVQSPEGLAVDWSSRNIFWTDSKKLTIEVANLDTKVRKVLFKKDGIFNPRGIVVHPGRGKIFWTDWNRLGPKIEWANMDGTQRGIFLDKPDVKLPNSLAIDWSRDRLCFTDAGLNMIKCVNIDTLQSETIVYNCSYPFGLAINKDNYYWSDWKTLKIEYINVQTQQKGQVPIATASRRLYGVAVVPEECPAQSNVCQHRNGQCDPVQLCLPSSRHARTCADGDDVNY